MISKARSFSCLIFWLLVSTQFFVLSFCHKDDDDDGGGDEFIDIDLSKQQNNGRGRIQPFKMTNPPEGYDPDIDGELMTNQDKKLDRGIKHYKHDIYQEMEDVNNVGTGANLSLIQRATFYLGINFSRIIKALSIIIGLWGSWEIIKTLNQLRLSRIIKST